MGRKGPLRAVVRRNAPSGTVLWFHALIPDRLRRNTAQEGLLRSTPTLAPMAALAVDTGKV